MVVRRVLIRARGVVFFKGVVEASEGLAAVYAEAGETSSWQLPPLPRREGSRRPLDDLCAELGAARPSP